MKKESTNSKICQNKKVKSKYFPHRKRPEECKRKSKKRKHNCYMFVKYACIQTFNLFYLLFN